MLVGTKDPQSEEGEDEKVSIRKEVCVADRCK
jgi:hypothetical protein